MHIAKLFRSENDPNLISLLVDTDEVATLLEGYNPDVVILDVDSLRHANALDVAVAIRERNSSQVIMFSSDRSNPDSGKRGNRCCVVVTGLLAKSASKEFQQGTVIPTANTRLQLNVTDGAGTVTSQVGSNFVFTDLSSSTTIGNIG